MTTGGSKAADAFLFTSLMALSASWPRREAGRCPGQRQRVRCTANPCIVGSSCIRGSCVGGQGPQTPFPSTLVVALGCAHACPLTWVPTSPSRRMFSSHSPETRSEASATIHSSRPTSSAYSSRHVTQAGAANALAGDVVQPENSVQPECKTLLAENIALDDASSDGKRL